jgi:hypothetical protein
LNVYLYVWNNPINFVDPEGLEISPVASVQGLPSGYYPYAQTDSLNPIEQVYVPVANIGSLVLNTVALGLDKLGQATANPQYDALQQSCLANGVPDPGDAVLGLLKGLPVLGSTVRVIDNIKE